MIKNKNCLVNYSRIAEYLDRVEKGINENDLDGGFINLRRVIESIDDELVRRDDWYKSKLLSRPTSEEIIKHLKETAVLSNEQADLFNSIRWLANKYVHGKNDMSKWNADFESLRNFTARLDRELPNLVSKMDEERNIYSSKPRVNLTSFFKKSTVNEPSVSNSARDKAQANAFVNAEQAQINAVKKKIATVRKERMWIYFKTAILAVIAIGLIVFIVKNKHNTEVPAFLNFDIDLEKGITKILEFLQKLFN